jgi:hypothetical protein
VVLSIAVAGVCGALASSSRQIDAMEVQAYCVSLAKQLTEEIAARGFDPPAANDSPGWTSGNHNRAQYDDIADYNGYLESFDAISSPTRVTDRLEFTRSVSVEFRASAAGAVNPAGDYAMITVTVTPSELGDSFVLQRLVARTTVLR